MRVDDVLAALDVKRCETCRTRAAQIAMARGDVGDAARKLHGAQKYRDDEAAAYWVEMIAARKLTVADAELSAEMHLAEVEHVPAEDKPLRRRRVAQTVKCERCGKRVAVVDGDPAGHMSAVNGRRCVKRQPVSLDVLPAVQVSRQRNGCVGAIPAQADASRLDAGSRCVYCDKWLPGERSVCGQCAAKPKGQRGVTA